MPCLAADALPNTRLLKMKASRRPISRKHELRFTLRAEHAARTLIQTETSVKTKRNDNAPPMGALGKERHQNSLARIPPHAHLALVLDGNKALFQQCLA